MLQRWDSESGVLSDYVEGIHKTQSNDERDAQTTQYRSSQHGQPANHSKAIDELNTLN